MAEKFQNLGGGDTIIYLFTYLLIIYGHADKLRWLNPFSIKKTGSK